MIHQGARRIRSSAVPGLLRRTSAVALEDHVVDGRRERDLAVADGVEIEVLAAGLIGDRRLAVVRLRPTIGDRLVIRVSTARSAS